jgi:hypothetical protein
MKFRYIVGALAAVLLAGGLFYFYSGRQTPSGQPPLDSLTAENVAEVKNQFNAAKDSVRVLLLLSPT